MGTKLRRANIVGMLPALAGDLWNLSNPRIFWLFKINISKEAAIQELWPEAFLLFLLPFLIFENSVHFFSVLWCLNALSMDFSKVCYPQYHLQYFLIPPVCKNVKNNDMYHPFKVLFLSCLCLTQNAPSGLVFIKKETKFISLLLKTRKICI